MQERTQQTCAGCARVEPCGYCYPWVDLPDDFNADAWVTSDHHWGHRNIARYQHRPKTNFAIMLRKWERTVAAEDTVLHLGDLVVYAGPDFLLEGEWLETLPGRKFLLRGNHDRQSDAWYREAGFEPLGRRPILWTDPETGIVVCFSHEPAHQDGSWTVNVHGHVHSNRPAAYVDVALRVNVSVEVRDYAPVRLRDILAICTHTVYDSVVISN